MNGESARSGSTATPYNTRVRRPAGVRFVLTTTKVLQVQKVVGPDTHVLEIIGKPYDLDLLLQLVRKAMPEHPR